MSGDPPGGVSREEFEALQRRVQALEARLGAPAPRPAPAPVLPPATPPPPPPPAPRPVAPPAPAAAPPKKASMETLLGQRFAPRAGAVLVFLASIFFLGVGIQRGWIGPLAQLGIAVAGAVVLLVLAEWLTRRADRGVYPRVLEGTAACVLYATAFVAHALPYYARVTGLTEVGGGVLMALVALGTVGLALWRDARVIAGLGYTLGFLTSMAGWGVLPGLTLPYVGLLGASLAVLVARKGWTLEGLAGTLLTGALFAGFFVDAVSSPRTSPWLVLLAATPAVAGFLWLSLRRASTSEGLAPILAGLTLAWAVPVSTVAAWGEPRSVGLIVGAWCLGAAALAVAARRARAEAGVGAVFGVASVLMYLVAPWFLLHPAHESWLPVTVAYAVGALALAALQRAFPAAARPLWSAGLALAAAAAVKAIAFDGPIAVFGDAGGWEAWAIFALVAPAFALLVVLAPRTGVDAVTRAAFYAGAVFLAVWGFALFTAAFGITAYLLVAGLALVALAPSSAGLRVDVFGAGFALVLLAAAKTAAFDVTTADLPGWLAGLEAVLAAGALLALHHLRPQHLARPSREGGAVLVGGSAVVLASYLLAYAEGPLASVSLGLLGVAYLAAGFARQRRESTHRYTGFGLLGFVLLRVFVVDLQEADLVVRALVFLVLGAILLGVGYVYARVDRAKPTETAPVEFKVEP